MRETERLWMEYSHAAITEMYKAAATVPYEAQNR